MLMSDFLREQLISHIQSLTPERLEEMLIAVERHLPDAHFMAFVHAVQKGIDRRWPNGR